jgi:hypothetical protein
MLVYCINCFTRLQPKKIMQLRLHNIAYSIGFQIFVADEVTDTKVLQVGCQFLYNASNPYSIKGPPTVR